MTDYDKICENGIDDLCRIMKSEIEKSKGRFVLLRALISAVEGLGPDMPAYLQGPEGKSSLFKAINKLEAERLIVPVGSRPNGFYGLHAKYKISKETAAKDEALLTEIVREIEPPARADYYLKNTVDYLVDREYIKIISQFLKNKESGKNEIITINERAYELFGDEKFFKGDEKGRSRGDTILRRLGLEYLDLLCVDTVEPFFSYQNACFFQKNDKDIYIIENKDTFWTFKRNVMEVSSALRPDMLIYGEGRKIISSFRFIGEFNVNQERDRIYYFGDLDPEGINIYCELKEKYSEYSIAPLCCCYKDLLDIGKEGKLPRKTHRGQRIDKGNIEDFSREFDEGVGEEIRLLLEGGYYIPQEALSAAKIKERYIREVYK